MTSHEGRDRLDRYFFNSAIKLVIPAVAERRAGIQKRPWDYWIPAFAGMTGARILDCIFNCQVNKWK